MLLTRLVLAVWRFTRLRIVLRGAPEKEARSGRMFLCGAFMFLRLGDTIALISPWFSIQISRGGDKLLRVKAQKEQE